MNLPKQPGAEVTRQEFWEWIAMIAIIISWWPRLFLGWGHPVYLALIYFVGPVLLVVIFRRRLKRMNEGLDHSKSIIDATQKAREEAEKATQNAKRKTQK